MYKIKKLIRTYGIAPGTLLMCYVVTEMGRKLEEEIYVYVQLIYFAVQQKLIHYKTTILE